MCVPPPALRDTFISHAHALWDMTRDPAKQVATLRRRIADGERGGSDADRATLLAFSDRLGLLSSEYSDHRHDKLLRHLIRISEHTEHDIVDALTDRGVSEDIVTWINDAYDNPETNRDYRVALRVFGRRMAAVEGVEDLTNGIPDAIEWIPSGTPRSYNPTPDPADMLRWDEVKLMIDHTPNPRDRALLALQFDAGLRSGELIDLTNGDIRDSQWGLQVRVDGKTGQRSVTLVPSVPFVKRWRFDDHPRSADEHAPLWCRLETGEDLSYRRFIDIFHTAAERVGIDKPATATNFRKSNASWLAEQGASSHLIEDRQGRARGSRAVSRYVARFGDAEGVRYAALHGADVEMGGDAADIAPPTCPRCGDETPADEPACVWCGQAMTPGAAEAAERVRAAFQEEMARSDDAETRSVLLDGLREIDTNPETAARMVELYLDTHE